MPLKKEPYKPPKIFSEAKRRVKKGRLTLEWMKGREAMNTRSWQRRKQLFFVCFRMRTEIHLM